VEDVLGARERIGSFVRVTAKMGVCPGRAIQAPPRGGGSG
jgi:hypothetical protein